MDLNGSRQFLERPSRVRAAFCALEVLQKGSNVDPDDERTEIAESFGHRYHAEVPSAVARDEQHDLVWRTQGAYTITRPNVGTVSVSVGPAPSPKPPACIASANIVPTILVVI